MLEPPPSAKPFTIDVDKKLEEGQKVITFLFTKLLPKVISHMQHSITGSCEDKMFVVHSSGKWLFHSAD